MADQLIRATAAEGGIRAVGVITTGLTEEARRRHKLSYVASAALGRTMSAGLLLASSMKAKQSRVNITVRGDGPLGAIHVDAGLDGTVRGYVDNPDVELPLTANGKLNVGGAVGNNGYLQVRRDEGYDPAYISTVELVSGEIGEDTTHYLLTSEQTPSALLLGEFVNAEGIRVAGGLLLQLVPKPSLDETAVSDPETQMTLLSGFSPPSTSGKTLLEIFDQLLADRDDRALVYTLESRLASLPGFTSLLRSGQTLQDILQQLLGDMGLEILPEVQDLRFHCRCSFRRMLGALKILGADELRDMIEKDGGAEATCHFCGQVYQANRDQLANLIGDLQAESST
ncbi:MAG: Hsp33 family molecular chaperone HslO [Actinomycetota bacterium]